MIFLAALQSIPGEYYEAAGIDGASALQRLRHITLHSESSDFNVCILELIFNFKIFDQVYSTTQVGGKRQPNDHHAAVRYSLQVFRMGDASSWRFVFLTLLIVTWYNGDSSETRRVLAGAAEAEGAESRLREREAFLFAGLAHSWSRARHHVFFPSSDGDHVAQDAPEIQRVPLQVLPDSLLNFNNYREVFQREPFDGIF